MELVMIRHAEPFRVLGAGTRADPDLTELGRAQARRAAEWLRKEAIDEVWSSPMRRALQTAAPLAELLGLPVQSDERLAEYDRDFEDYIPTEEMRATRHPRWQAMVEGRWDEIASVDLPTFRVRVGAALEERIAANPGGRVAVFSHGGVINVWIGTLLGIDRPLWFDPVYASISRVVASRDGVRSILTLNESAHLRDLA
jgi:probable phosphoglycerate mutase